MHRLGRIEMIEDAGLVLREHATTLIIAQVLAMAGKINLRIAVHQAFHCGAYHSRRVQKIALIRQINF
jgi:hypothetical protein